MATPLELRAGHDANGAPVVTAIGELDLSNVDALAEALEHAVSGAAPHVVTVDLSAVEYLDSAAINALFTHADHIRVRANPTVMPVLTVSGLAELVTVVDAHGGA